MMNRISAGSNLSIDMTQEHWRLLSNGDGVEKILVEARPGQPLRYVATFGTQRRLPHNGTLSLDEVDRVVLGWSNRDESWHLGLMLKPELAQARGSRWCGLAFWPDPDTDLYRDLAARAGETLAQKLDRPFTLIPPRTDGAAPAYGTTHKPSAPATLPDLPFRIEHWKLERIDPMRLELKLSPAWGRARLLRVVWYMFWAGVFVVLSVASLSAGIAASQPEFLPYAGLAGAAFLIIFSIVTLIGAMRRIKRIEIDGITRTISGMQGKRVRWTYNANQLNSVYVSLLLTKANRRKQTRQATYGELNLCKYDGTFHHVISQGQADEKLPVTEGTEAANVEQVVPLTPENAHTRLQAAALLIAQTLQLPAYYDQRIK
ncbi:MAG TPA: hypothetical protein VK003_07900 [Oceanobacillus sp.]|nr:hypothetical protein [Oceanobacillus sp.]